MIATGKVTATTVVLTVTTTLTSLMAGLFYSWSCSITPGLAGLSDQEYIAAMQSINRAIQNPLFFTGFFGAAVLLPLSTYLTFRNQPRSPAFWCLVAATVLYLGGVMGVTIFGNVPLNNALDSFNLRASSAEETDIQRTGFELLWTRLNTIRTVASAMSLVLAIMACINQRKQD